ncbi:MAG: CPBP family intramembrane glutamic endopeptidase [Akkermansiaceae bacterium]
MQRSALADVAKVLAFIMGSFVLAALLSSPLYEMGKGFADVTLKKDTTDELKWLAQKAQDAEFTRYFKRALMISAVLLLFPLISSLRLRTDPRKLRDTPWSIYLPPEAIAPAQGQALQKARGGILQLVTGFFLASGLFLAMAWLLFHLNWFNWSEIPNQSSLLAAAKKAVTPAIFASLIEEILFRGALLAIFLRAFRPSVAIIALSLLFAAVHFLQPPSGAQVSDPTSIHAGFEMLRLIAERFLEPQLVLYEFVSLFIVGLILAYARYGTASLWLPIGLHTGWVFSLKMFNRLTERRPDLPSKFDVYMGHKITEGILPIVTLSITAGIIAIYIRGLHPAKTKTPVVAAKGPAMTKE